MGRTKRKRGGELNKINKEKSYEQICNRNFIFVIIFSGVRRPGDEQTEGADDSLVNDYGNEFDRQYDRFDDGNERHGSADFA
jgi:hypothetical protein